MPPVRPSTRRHWVLQSLSRAPVKYHKARVREVNGLSFGSNLRGPVYQDTKSEFVIPPPCDILRPASHRGPPLQLSDLECIRTLGAGASGTVLLVRTKGCRRRFAVKVWRKKHMRCDDRSINWDAKNLERAFLGQLPWNPFVAGIVDALHDERNLYLVMECIPNSTLRDLLRKAPPLPLSMAAFYFANIVCGLEFLAKHKICHRDLKPENLLIDGTGYLVIADFGIAARNDDSAETWYLMGTTVYMAPELFYSMKPELYVDWWSAGCILYEMATAKLPFLGTTDKSISRRAFSGVIHYPANVRVGQTLKDLIAGLLNADPLDRIGRHGAYEAMEHPWVSHISWDKMRARNYVAPKIPEHKYPLHTWQKLPLPEQRQIPGLEIAHIPELLQFDERFPLKPLV